MAKKLSKLVVTIFVVYFTAAAVVVLMQRSLIYQVPSVYGKETPSNYGLNYEEIKIPVANQEINAWFIKNPAAKKTMIYFHGNGANLPGLAFITPIFYSYGWNALLFDYRGYGKSSPTNLSQESVTSDGIAIYDWLIKSGVNAEDIIFWGHSLGAAVATQVAFKRHPRFLILEGAFSSIRDMAALRYPWLPLFDFMIFDKFETTKVFSTLKIPTLILHAINDEVIPFELGRKVFDSISSKKELIIIEGAGHNGFPNVHKKYTQKILSFE